MKYNAFFKFLAIVISVICVVSVLVSGICVFVNLNYGLYTNSPGEKQSLFLAQHGSNYADYLAEHYVWNLSGMSYDLWNNWFGTGHLISDITPQVDYRITITHPDRSIVSEDTRKSGREYVYDQTIWTSQYTGFAIEADASSGTAATIPNETLSTGETEEPTPTGETTEPAPSGAFFPSASVQHIGGSDISGEWYHIYRYGNPVDFTVELFYTQDEYNRIMGSGNHYSALMELIYRIRYEALAVFASSVLVLLSAMTYLGFAAGRKPGTKEIRPGGLNRLPLDLYTAADCGIGFCLVWALAYGVLDTIFTVELWTEPFWVLLASGAGLCGLIGLICILFWCAFWAQVKAPEGFWWKNTLAGRLGSGVFRLIASILRKLGSLITGRKDSASEPGPGLAERVRRFHRNLPLMWQWLTVSLVIFGGLAIFGLLCRTEVGLCLYGLMVCFGIAAIVHAAGAFGTLRDGAKRMSRGELDAQIDTGHLGGCFYDFACDLNDLSDACVTAAREQLKSERMKTELITNVSHDIKTPLTSIINYVDLLQKAQTEQERKEYLDVLERQSARLKKLIEDLMEMSKASSGNVAAVIEPTDVAESLNQALGEYADRFDTLKLSVVLRKPQEPVAAMCDGKLLWRVLSNLLGNVVKYALPGTRVYLDLTAEDQKVRISLKNISREALNITADELMERFVRGDESRNTEGNGLGLNIARSLMEVQHGSLELLVDGDLFKVVLTLPRAEALPDAEPEADPE